MINARRLTALRGMMRPRDTACESAILAQAVEGKHPSNALRSSTRRGGSRRRSAFTFEQSATRFGCLDVEAQHGGADADELVEDAQAEADEFRHRHTADGNLA